MITSRFTSAPKVLFVVALGGPVPEHAKAAVRCARAFSGLEVVAIADQPIADWLDAKPYRHLATDLESFKKGHAKRHPGAMFSAMRWCVMREYLLRQPPAERDRPFCSVDWDVCVYQPLWPHFEAMGAAQFEIGWTLDKERGGGNGVASLLMDPLILDEFIEAAQNAVWGDPQTNDMWLWGIVGRQHSTIDLSVEHAGAYFDHNLALDEKVYVHEGKFKKIVWRDAKPHFVRIRDGGLVKAVGIHYWTCSERIPADVQRSLGAL
jgi:hypothetical protein